MVLEDYLNVAARDCSHRSLSLVDLVIAKLHLEDPQLHLECYLADI